MMTVDGLMNPVLVKVTRGPAVESCHRGTLVICDPQGREVLGIGNPDALVFPRSAIKPLQAIPLLESGAAAKYRLSQREIALACASHNGEAAQVNEVAAWLQRLGLDHTHLECGPQSPRTEAALYALAEQGQHATRIHNNCSGKHSGFLNYCVHHGHDTHGYIDAQHPVQQAWIKLVSEFSETDLQHMPQGVDGCGIPVIATPLRALAHAMAKFAAPATQGGSRQAAIEQIHAAMAAEPFMVGGSQRFCTEMMRITGSKALVKVGAEGVYCGVLPEQQLGIAIKIDDGTVRAAEVVMAATLQALGIFSADQWQRAKPLAEPVLHNFMGLPVGQIQASQPLQQALQQL